MINGSPTPSERAAADPPAASPRHPATGPRSRRRRARRGDSGGALFSALGSSIRLLRWLLIGLVGLYLTSGFTRVGPQEDALIYRLGKLQPTVHPPGFLFALPAPIDRVVRVPTRTQHELLLTGWQSEEPAAQGNEIASPAAATPTTPAVPVAQTSPRRQPYFSSGGGDLPMSASLSVLSAGSPFTSGIGPGGRGLHPARDGYTLTADVNLVQASFAVRYRIVDPVAWVKAASPETAVSLIESACYHAAMRALATTKVDDALGNQLEHLRDTLRSAAEERINRLQLGIELVAVDIQQLVPPPAVLSAFNDVTSAQVEARTVVEEARTYHAQVLPKAQSDAYRLRQQSDAERAQTVAKAQGEMSAFLALLAEYRAAPTLIGPRLRAETLEEVLPRLKYRTMVPSDSGPLHLLIRENR